MAVTEQWMPWLDAAWARWRERLETGRLPHAVLLDGPKGTGRRHFAERLCRAYLCTGPSAARPCGRCASCRWNAVGSHPDYHVLSPEDSRELKVDQVRALIERLMLSGTSGFRTAIIDPADAFNRSSANAFLKTLEEPPAGVLLVLLAEQSARLPATILSRCQRQTFRLPPEDEALAWLDGRGGADEPERREALRLAGGSAGEALRLLHGEALAQRRALVEDLRALARRRDDPVSVAERWQKLDCEDLLAWLARWLADVARDVDGSHCGRSPLQPVLRDVDWRLIFRLYDQVVAARAELDSQLRRDLLLEGLLIRWCRMTASPEEPVT